jgi:hypothetical protein
MNKCGNFANIRDIMQIIAEYMECNFTNSYENWE